jgi:hypothetical protein
VLLLLLLLLLLVGEGLRLARLIWWGGQIRSNSIHC